MALEIKYKDTPVESVKLTGPYLYARTITYQGDQSIEITFYGLGGSETKGTIHSHMLQDFRKAVCLMIPETKETN